MSLSTSAPASSSAPARAAEPALEVRDLTGPVGSAVIRDVALQVPRGSTHLVLGPIHSGKSMLLRHLVGLECASRGTITIAGERFDAAQTVEWSLRQLRRRVGVVFEGSALITRIGVLDNVELPLLEHTEISPQAARETARELLAEVGLRVDDATMPAELGRAQQRRVALARAMALRPPVLLLDEPSIRLDSHAAAELDEVIARLQSLYDCGVLLFSHEVRHAFGRAQWIYVMEQGAIADQGTRQSLQDSTQPVVRQLLHRRGGT